jgi:hypothetical protein
MSERAVVLEEPGLDWSAGAPQPFVVSSEDRTCVGFHRRENPADYAEVDQITVAELVRCTCFKFGFPNDEALQGHRLFGHGLEFYRLHEVADSAWLRELRGVEAVHPLAAAVPFESARHFVLTFHDTTLEAIATGIRVIGTYRSRGDAVALMATLVGLT